MKTLPIGVIALLTTSVALAQNGNMMNGGTGHDGWIAGDGWMGGYGGVCLSIIFVFIIISFVVWIVNRGRK
jgi:uncharacterized membrane protein